MVTVPKDVQKLLAAILCLKTSYPRMRVWQLVIEAVNKSAAGPDPYILTDDVLADEIMNRAKELN